MLSQNNILPLGSQASTSTEALARLFLLMSHTFSYPSYNDAYWTTSRQFLDRASQLFEVANIESASLCAAAFLFCNAAVCNHEEKAHGLRVEHTRLFILSPRVVPLVGTRWVEAHGSLAKRQSERALVEKEYRALSLCNSSKTKEPADHLVSELDYVAYVTAAENRASEEGDAASASEWKLLRDVFIVDHLSSLAIGAADAILRHSENPFLRMHAVLLREVVSACMP